MVGRLTLDQEVGVRIPAPQLGTKPGDQGKDERRSCRTFGRMDTLGLDTIAGAKLLQLKFGSAGAFQPDQAVMHGDRRARFIRMSDGAAMIRHSGSSHPVAVALETLSLPPEERDYPAPRGAARADARRAGASPTRSRLGLRAETGRFPRHHPQRRPPLRP